MLLQLVRRRLAGMKWSSSKLKRRSAARATERWPLWMGSRSAENRDAARMMFFGGAMRLRCGQRGSQKVRQPGLIKAARDSNSLTNLPVCSCHCWTATGADNDFKMLVLGSQRIHSES